ncbi:hypothetical protein GTA08_BOTSDO08500 [Botryosphaeria dothidea]|uniref:Uncharacterized protein n=1 Tax=Botryosphaeria dothidea TaxID=55169 RepID=A0A8H4IS80_9PEZI|nr:hypothetical protein GTA08_BOTSDO08500 [Botryosphaeria dothidea]
MENNNGPFIPHSGQEDQRQSDDAATHPTRTPNTAGNTGNGPEEGMSTFSGCPINGNSTDKSTEATDHTGTPHTAGTPSLAQQPFPIHQVHVQEAVQDVRDCYRKVESELLRQYQAAYETITNLQPRTGAHLDASQEMYRRQRTAWPGTICADIVRDLEEDTSDWDGDTRAMAHRVSYILEHMAVFDFQQDGDEISIVTGVDELLCGTVRNSYEALLTVFRLGEQLISIGLEVNARVCAESDKLYEGDMKDEFLHTNGLVQRLHAAITALGDALRRPDDGLVHPLDYLDDKHPSALALLRARIRCMRGHYQWALQNDIHEGCARMNAIINTIPDATSRSRIYECLKDTSSVYLFDRIVQARNTVADLDSPPPDLLPTMASVTHVARILHIACRQSDLIALAHHQRDLSSLPDTFARAMASVSAQLSHTDSALATLAFPRRHALRAAVSAHNLSAAAATLFGTGTPGTKALHAFAVYFLATKSTTLLHHLDPTLPYTIPLLTPDNALRLARLFLRGAHAFRDAQRHNHDQRGTVALAWLCGLVDAWFAWLADARRAVAAHPDVAADAAAWFADVETLEGPGGAVLRALVRRGAHLVHASDLFVGLPLGWDGAFGGEWPVGDGEGLEEADGSVEAAFVEMRRFVVWPAERGVLEGGRVGVRGGEVKRWAWGAA